MNRLEKLKAIPLLPGYTLVGDVFYKDGVPVLRAVPADLPLSGDESEAEMNNRQMSESLKLVGRQIPHPGEFLKELMDKSGINIYALSQKSKLSDMTISGIINGHIAITADTAIGLSKCFASDAQSWLFLQFIFEREHDKFCPGKTVDCSHL